MEHREFLDQIHIELTQRGSSKSHRGGTRPNGVEVQQGPSGDFRKTAMDGDLCCSFEEET